MGMESVDPAFRHFATEGFLEIDGSLDGAVRHPQRIRRRTAPTHGLADSFLQIDDGARLVHANSLASAGKRGEQSF